MKSLGKVTFFLFMAIILGATTVVAETKCDPIIIVVEGAGKNYGVNVKLSQGEILSHCKAASDVNLIVLDPADGLDVDVSPGEVVVFSYTVADQYGNQYTSTITIKREFS